MVYARYHDEAASLWTTLQFAATKGRLAACKLLVEHGAEVYTNPMNSYPPVMEAAYAAERHHSRIESILRRCAA